MIAEGRFQVASYYRFVRLPDFAEVRAWIREIGLKFDIKGSVLIAPEGINSTICGTPENVESYFNALGEDPRFKDFEKRISYTDLAPFGRFKVRLKKEIVAMKTPLADPNDGVGDYVDPKDWNELIQDPEVLVIDVRNRYETEMGTFKGAVDPSTDFFSEFPRFVEEHMSSKDQTVAAFCTGGIRCEKATAYLISQGFTNVKHLKGGILSYLEQVPDDQSLWKGACFVFDDREALNSDLDSVRNGESTLYKPWPRRSKLPANQA